MLETKERLNCTRNSKTSFCVLQRSFERHLYRCFWVSSLLIKKYLQWVVN